MSTMTKAVTVPAQHTDLTDTIETLTATAPIAPAGPGEPVSVFYRVDFDYRPCWIQSPGYIYPWEAERQARMMRGRGTASVLVDLDHEVTTDAQREALRIDLITTYGLDQDTWITGVHRMGRDEVPWGVLVAADAAQELERAPRGWRGLAGVALRHLGVSR